MKTMRHPVRSCVHAFVLILLPLAFGWLGLSLCQVPPAAALQAFTATPRPTPVPGASLTVVMGVESKLVNDLNGNGLVDPGDGVRYFITYLNSGTVALGNVILVNDYDGTGIDSIANITANGVDNPDANTITWELGTLRPAAGGTIAYEARLIGLFPPQGSRKIENRVRMTSDQTDVVSTSFALDVRIPKLNVSKNRQLISDANSNGQVDAGDTIRYTIKVGNDGSVEAANVLVMDDYDQNLLDQPAVISEKGANNGDVIRWNIDRLDKGTEVFLTYETTVIQAMPVGNNSVKNLVTVSSNGTSPITAQNSFTVEVLPTVTASPGPVPTPVSGTNVSAGPTTSEGISGMSQALLAAGFMFLSLGGLIELGYLAYKKKEIPSTLRDGYILSLVMGTVIILGLAGSVERSAIAGLIGTVAGYVLRSVVESGKGRAGGK